MFQDITLLEDYFIDEFTLLFSFFFQAEDGIRDCLLSRGLGDVYKRQEPVKNLMTNKVLNPLFWGSYKEKSLFSRRIKFS